eukprot:sb/3475657/
MGGGGKERMISGESFINYNVVTGNRPSKQQIRTRYLGHVIGYQPIRDQYFPIRSVPGSSYYIYAMAYIICGCHFQILKTSFSGFIKKTQLLRNRPIQEILAPNCLITNHVTLLVVYLFLQLPDL